MALIRLEEITKTYHMGEIEVPVLRGVSLEIQQGEMVALMGTSGSGKTTLMNLLGCLDRPIVGPLLVPGGGNLRIHGRPAGPPSQPENRLRLPELQPACRGRTALDQVIMPLTYSADENPRAGGKSSRAANCWRTWDLASGCTTSRARCPAASSSAWPSPARSSISPPLLLADEPTGKPRLAHQRRDPADVSGL